MWVKSFSQLAVISGHWRLLPVDMVDERQAGYVVDVLRHASSGSNVQASDTGPGKQTDQSIAEATMQGDAALLAEVPADKHPR